MPDDIFDPEENTRKPPAPVLAFALAVALLIIFWGATTWVARTQQGDADAEESRRAELRAKTLAELRADSVKKLGAYAWVDRAKGTVQIPVAEAMKLVLPEINTPPRAAYPIATPPANPASSQP